MSLKIWSRFIIDENILLAFDKSAKSEKIKKVELHNMNESVQLIEYIIVLSNDDLISK